MLLSHIKKRKEKEKKVKARLVKWPEQLLVFQNITLVILNAVLTSKILPSYFMVLG